MRRGTTRYTVIRNRGKTDYELVDNYPEVMRTSRDCVCGKRMKKGDEVRLAVFLSMRSGFHIRHKRYCSEDCIPNYFYGGDEPKYVAPATW